MDEPLPIRTIYRAFLLVLVSVIVALHLGIAILKRRDPAFRARVEKLDAARREAQSRPHGPAARAFFGLISLFCFVVTGLGAAFFVAAQDLRIWIAIVLLPALYLALTCGYVAATGKRTSFADASVFLWW